MADQHGGVRRRLYWEYWGQGYFNVKGVSLPAVVSVFPDELVPSP